jgi:hypothetical protein
MRNRQASLVWIASALLTACGAGDAPPETGIPDSGGALPVSGEPIGTVTIVEPVYSADIMGTSVTVQLAVEGFPIVEAGDMTPGTGHHHLFLDADVTDLSEPIPTVPGSIVHMGDGSSEYTFEGVGIGQHRLIAIVADGAHVPLRPLVTDTVVFVVH